MKGNSGVTLVELIVGASLLVVAGVSVMTVMQRVQKGRQTLAAAVSQQSQTQLATSLLEANSARILSLATDPKSTSTSCPALKQSLSTGVPAEGSCAFFDEGNLQITGTDSAPLTLTLTGSRKTPTGVACGAVSVDCPLALVGRFRRVGANVEVWAEITQRVNVPGKERLADQTRFDNKGAERSDGVPVVVMPINRIRTSCGKGTNGQQLTLVGYKPDGSPECKDAFDGATCPVGSLVNGVCIVPSENAAVNDNVIECQGKDEYVRGITADGRPICAKFPKVWVYLETRMCLRGSGVPAESSCATHSDPIPDCHAAGAVPVGGTGPDHLPCGNGSLAFCKKEYGPFGYIPVPKSSGELVLEASRSAGDVEDKVTNLGSFINWAASNGGQCQVNSGSDPVTCSLTNVWKSQMTLQKVEASKVRLTTPVAALHLVRVMKCVPPIGQIK